MDAGWSRPLNRRRREELDLFVNDVVNGHPMLCKNDLEDNIAQYIKDRVPKAEMRLILDVGANVGWFSHEFGKIFREAEFYLFEPSPPIFMGIEQTLTRFPEFNLWRRAHL